MRLQIEAEGTIFDTWDIMRLGLHFSSFISKIFFISIFPFVSSGFVANLHRRSHARQLRARVFVHLFAHADPRLHVFAPCAMVQIYSDAHLRCSSSKTVHLQTQDVSDVLTFLCHQLQDIYLPQAAANDVPTVAWSGH